MKVLIYSAIALLSITAISIIIISLKSGKPIRVLLLNALIGIVAIAAIDLTTRFTGVYIPINQWTVCGGAVYGVPAVCGILVFNLILG